MSILDNLDLEDSIKNELIILFSQTKKYNPKLSEKHFLKIIIEEWLSFYRKNIEELEYNKENTALRNNLKNELQKVGISQGQLAKEIRINRSYLSEVINEKSDPSLKTGLLILNALGHSPKIKNIFWLEKLE